jgi:thiol-disulfide isomerase/thioredoxin
MRLFPKSEGNTLFKRINDRKILFMKLRNLALIAFASLITSSCTKEPSVSQSPESPIAANAGASNTSTTALAKELQGKPVVVDVYASWCPSCKNIAPTLSTLKQEYKGKANFVVLDVTDKATSKATEEKVKKLGLSSFFKANKSKTSTVAVIDPATGKIIKQFQNNPDKADYKTVLDEAIAQSK